MFGIVEGEVVGSEFIVRVILERCLEVELPFPSVAHGGELFQGDDSGDCERHIVESAEIVSHVAVSEIGLVRIAGIFRGEGQSEAMRDPGGDQRVVARPQAVGHGLQLHPIDGVTADVRRRPAVRPFEILEPVRDCGDGIQRLPEGPNLVVVEVACPCGTEVHERCRLFEPSVGLDPAPGQSGREPKDTGHVTGELVRIRPGEPRRPGESREVHPPGISREVILQIRQHRVQGVDVRLLGTVAHGVVRAEHDVSIPLRRRLESLHRHEGSSPRVEQEQRRPALRRVVVSGEIQRVVLGAVGGTRHLWDDGPDRKAGAWGWCALRPRPGSGGHRRAERDDHRGDTPPHHRHFRSSAGLMAPRWHLVQFTTVLCS